ncbi:histidine kinase [Spirosoma harenae]
MNKRLSPIAIHVLGCLIFLALPYLFAEDGFAKLSDLPYDPREQRNVLSYVLTIAFFYTNYYLLIPKFFFRKQYISYGLCALGCFLLIEGTLVLVSRQGVGPVADRHFPAPPEEQFSTRMPPPPFPGAPPPDKSFSQSGPRRRGGPSELTQTFFLTLAGFLMAIVVRVNNRWRETEREKIQSELLYLKAQINPHFLFNTLNSIYSLAIIESPPTADAIVKLSSFLRYVIQESQKDQVSLRNELDYIDHYISLQRLRLGDTAQINFSVSGHANGKQIVPLLLISFIENAFKYGVSPEEPSAIDMAIVIDEQQLSCHVFNRKVRVFQPTAVASGIGLTNTKARLQHLYPDRHQLRIEDKPDSFTVDLTITLS